jgi:hypothetical protein
LKLYLILVLCIFCDTTVLFSQSDCDEYKVIRTDPSNPENTEKPSKKNGVDKNSTQPHNGAIFNWTADTENGPAFPLNSSLLINNQVLSSPFWEYNNPRMEIFRNQWVKNSRIDNLPEDGWELIHQDFGYTDNGMPRGASPTPGEKVGYPHIVLYNRFRGQLRVFVNFAGISGNTAKMRLEFNTGPMFIQTSLLDMAYATEIQPLNALDDFRGENSVAKQARISGWSEFGGIAPNWCYADFPVMYDPCTCFKESKLYLEVEIVKSAKISLKGSINGELIDKTDNNDGKTVKTLPQDANSTYSIGENWSAGVKVAEKATQTYSSVNSFTNATSNRFESHFYVGSNVSVAMKEEVNKNKEIAQENLRMLNYAMSYSGGTVHNTGSILHTYPYIGTAFSTLDFFSCGGSSSVPSLTPQRVSVSPIAMNDNISLEGEITSSEIQKILTLWNPGSNIPNLNNVNYEYPYYNHTMGVMNLWKTPRIETHKYYHHTMGPNYGVLYYTKILDDLEYVINPAAGLSMSPSDLDISASLVIDFGKDELDCNEGTPIDGVTFAYPYSEFFHWENERVASTPFFPIGCIKEINPKFYTPCESNNPQMQISPRYYLKIVALLKRKDHDSSKQKVVWEGVYKFKEQEYDYTNHTSMINYFNIPTTIPGIKKDVVLSSFTEKDSITNDRLAWRTVKIKKGTKFDKKSHIVVMAGYSIEVDPDVEIPENVELKIGLPFTCTTSVSPKTITVNDCNSNTYMKNRRFAYLPVQKKTSEYASSAMFEAIPNPSHNTTNIYYYVEKEGNVHISLSDALGRKIDTIVDMDNHEVGSYHHTIDTSLLPNGVYYCTFFDGTNYRTISLIVFR